MPTSKRRLLMAAFGLAAIFIVFLTFEQSRRPAPRYTVTDLGLLPGYTQSEATAINSRGDVLVGNIASGSYLGRASLYRGGKLYDLGTLPGAIESYAYGINARDEVTGFVAMSRVQHAFLYKNGKMQDLGTLPGFPISRGVGINDKGEIAGEAINYAAPPGPFQHRAFLYRQGKMTDLGTPPGCSESHATSIDAAGNIFGSCRKIATSGSRQPCEYDSRTGKIKVLVTPTPYRDIWIRQCNDRGQIIGSGWARTSNSFHAVLWKGSQITDLGTLLDRDTTYGDALNNGGVAVGSAWTQSGGLADYVNDHPLRFSLLLPLARQSTAEHAFVYRNGKMEDLNELIPNDADWILEEARSINDAGQIIGRGLHHGQSRAVLLTPVR